MLPIHQFGGALILFLAFNLLIICKISHREEAGMRILEISDKGQI